MDRDTVSRIESWESRPLTDGYAGLQALAERSFSGAVSSNGSWVLVLNGRIIGVPAGGIEAFESGDGTAYVAPDPSVPLLFAMRDAGGQREGRYFTDDTPLSEVHETLSAGNFTGYVELSENVLSGDYYVCYYGGRSLSLAFVGNAERLLTGDEAYERATDEVGIFEVYSVDLDVTTIPEPAEPEPDVGAGAAVVNEAEGTEDDTSTPTSAEADGPSTEPAEEAGGESTETPEDPASANRPVPDTTPSEPPDDPSPAPAAEPTEESAAETTAEPEAGPDDDPFSEEAAWRKSTTIPALDPEETEDPAAGSAPRTDDPTPRTESGQPDDAPTESAQSPPAAGTDDPRPAVDEDLTRLREQLETAITERDRLAEEREELRQRLEELEAARSSQDAEPESTGPNRELSVQEALDGTDLFVRYGSRGQSTLEAAHDDEANRETVIQNLRIEEHTRFDADAVAVDGRPYESFLEAQLEYRFVNWVAQTLLFEIRDTGNQRALKAVYDALPEIDRAEFNGTVTIRDEEGTEHSQAFDVVIRDRMGQPLFVAQLNDQRDPATGGMMADLIERASDVAEGHETLVGVFLVTASFFQPDALETANEATGGGFFSRDAKRSFVRLTRRSGYHLCLVEARRGEFHVAVPEF